jgi:hypothetical protein
MTTSGASSIARGPRRQRRSCPSLPPTFSFSTKPCSADRTPDGGSTMPACSVFPRPGTRAIVCRGAPPITAWRKANEKNEISGQRHVIIRNSGSPRSRGRATTATFTGPAGTVLLIEGRVFSCGQRCKRGFTALVASVADPRSFDRGGTSRPGSGWCQSKTRPGAKNGSATTPSRVIAICAACSQQARCR